MIYKRRYLTGPGVLLIGVKIEGGYAEIGLGFQDPGLPGEVLVESEGGSRWKVETDGQIVSTNTRLKIHGPL